jgi:hypothetical protein
MDNSAGAAGQAGKEGSSAESAGMKIRDAYYAHGKDRRKRRFTVVVKVVSSRGGQAYSLVPGILVCSRDDQFEKKFGIQHAAEKKYELKSLPQWMKDHVVADSYAWERIMKQLHKLKAEAEKSAMAMVERYRRDK